MKKRGKRSSGGRSIGFPDWGRLDEDDLKPIGKEWLELLSKSKPREETLHAFLAKHAQLAFWDDFQFAAVISKLRLGAELVTDFVAVYDSYSLGIRYKLIEIERPDMDPFTKEGILSSGLSRAIQQVLSWRQWLDEHSSEAKRLFPSLYFKHDQRTVFRYEIIIGNRENSAIWLDRRNALAESLGISIRSFDSISPRFRRTIGFGQFSEIGDEKYECDNETLNRLACPFVRALTDSSWRQMLKEGRREHSHFMGWYGNILVKFRQENEYADRFRRLIRKREQRYRKRDMLQ